MGRKRFAKNPMLYIHQPTIGTPKAPMQHNYTTPKQTFETGVQETKNAQPIYKKRKFFNQEEIPPNEHGLTADETEGEDDQDISEDHKQKEEKPKFKDMSIEQKIAYFVNTPSYAPQKRCEIKTDERTYRGVITDSKEDHVFIRVGKRSSSTKIPIEEIKNIRLLGF